MISFRRPRGTGSPNSGKNTLARPLVNFPPSENTKICRSKAKLREAWTETGFLKKQQPSSPGNTSKCQV